MSNKTKDQKELERRKHYKKTLDGKLAKFGLKIIYNKELNEYQAIWLKSKEVYHSDKDRVKLANDVFDCFI